MEKNGHSVEAKHLAVICNWRRACDERGLAEEERTRFNQELLDYLLDELMPWHVHLEHNDYSLLEVNRYCSLLCSFRLSLLNRFRETLLIIYDQHPYLLCSEMSAL